ncbi:MAG: DNA helicase/exodeoxyribonuclease V subunit B [Rhodocyclaceae bacterium]|nr:MAG: DNA helicase/exodeoxyribonuclease V subunit B [Rhodocyclaceae bacterium]TND00229.1 MAG: DNA helicase/exodeoxyribonuclease V subunit B [Rhodocyclaceae bacterium]
MIRSDLPFVSLAELPGGPEPLVLCATARLATGLRRAHGELQAARGAVTWQALQSSTPAMWLDHLSSSALLRGEIQPASVPGTFLSRAQERSLWEQAIARDTGAVAELFDREGMALAAMEAASLQRAWRIEVPEPLHTEEYRAFLRWRDAVAEACQAGSWRTADEVMAWRIECIARGIGGLPARLGIAGFIAPDPLVSRLLVVLEARGVELFRLDFGRGETMLAAGAELPDAEAECIAAANWARDRLARDASSRVRIAVADLPARRRLLESALENSLHPDAVGVGWAALERDFAFAAGSPLAAEPLVDVALRLLQLLVHSQRVAQTEFGALLCGPGWSADVDEADARASIEAVLRELLPPETSLERLVRAVLRQADALQASRLAADLGALLEAARRAPRRQLPSAWAAVFAALLDALGWPGQRTLLATERAAVDELREALGGLLALDGILGRVDGGEALRQLQRQCRDQAFAAARQTPARVEICSLADALAGPVDGLWVMGLNEGAWPPAPRPNPLLPAELQRRAGIAAARADSLAVEAQSLQALWCESAGEVVFSWAQREGERPLRASPLLAEIPRREWPSLPVMPFSPEPLERLDDAKAPPVGADERIRGGTALLAAQAVCPAWAFYQYRLGAAVLPAPTFGLDARARGSLLHAALEEFWRGRSLADLTRMDEVTRGAEIRRVVAHALAEFDRDAVEPLPPRLRQLEGERLQALLAVWLEVEAQRAPFRVVGCEERHALDIEGLPVRVTIDRIDELEDGRLVVIDYKSGRKVSADSWAEQRISEPQLPIYAALAFPGRAVAAVALARVTRDEPGFLGVAESDGLLPDVKALDAQRKRYAEDEFPDWQTLRRLWAERITDLAREVRDGIAAVVFDDEKNIQYCDVRPLLRVAERRQQFDETGEP